MDHAALCLQKRALNRQLFNPTTLKHRAFEGHIATAKNCGTHWIKYMLSLALAEKYNLPPPKDIRDDSIVGHTKSAPVYDHIPHIAVTHSHPHYLLRVPGIFTAVQLPQFVVLVRDIRAILVSMYEKSKGEHIDKKLGRENVTFSEFLRGDITGKTRFEDIWGLILFFNSWGAVIKRHRAMVLPVRYEDLQADTFNLLREICDHIGFEMEDKYLHHAIEKSSKENMKKNMDEKGEKIVSTDERDWSEWYSDADLNFVRDTLNKHLKYDFGYKY